MDRTPTRPPAAPRCPDAPSSTRVYQLYVDVDVDSRRRGIEHVDNVACEVRKRQTLE